MKVRRETAADHPGAYIHDASFAPPPHLNSPPTPFQISPPLQIWELLMYWLYWPKGVGGLL